MLLEPVQAIGTINSIIRLLVVFFFFNLQFSGAKKVGFSVMPRTHDRDFGRKKI